MDGDPHLSRPGFDDLLAWIETQLEGPLTLEWIARRSGLSPHHFSRLFTAAVGRSVMAHVRYRRLTRTARRLAVDPHLKLIDLAFDSGFDSQEAFTRAFTRAFGASPGRLRRAYLGPTLEGSMSAIAPAHGEVRVERLPELIWREAFSVAGLSHRFDEGTKLAIPGLWRRLMERMPFDPQRGWEIYGVVSRA